MAEPTKDNTEILTKPEAFNAALERARQTFALIDGVAGVGFGRKVTGDALTERIAIVIFVREKKPEEALAPADRIPKSFEGFPTDVHVVTRGQAEVCNNETSYDRIAGGMQIVVQDGAGAGTLGCIVKKRSSLARENVYLLTNKHVLFSEKAGRGSTVYHPKEGMNALGPVEAAFYQNAAWPPDVPGALDYFIDCGIARIDLDSTCCCCTCTQDSTKADEAAIIDLDIAGDNTLHDVRSVISDPAILTEKVFKVGRTTGKTTGIVTLVGAPLSADPPPDHSGAARVSAMNLIKIRFDLTSTPDGKNCVGLAHFTEPGDSGSLIVDEQNRAIGLHTHGSVDPADGIKYSYSCHILPVLDYLGICIPCVAIPTLFPSHGNSLASDGSGVAPRALPPDESPLLDGEIMFTRGAAPPGLVRPRQEFTPLEVSDAEVDHMHALLAQFRATPLGPDIHEMFGLVRREIAYLVRNVRVVQVAWARNQGPAFLVHVLNHIMGRGASIPHEVRGVSRRQLLLRMHVVLNQRGSKLVRESLEHYGDLLLDMFGDPDCNTVDDCIARLKAKEPA